MLDDHDLPDHTLLEYVDGGIQLCSRLPKPGYYKLSLMAGENEAELKYAGDFLLYSDAAEHECRPFPGVFHGVKEFRARLLEPRDGQVPAGQPTVYRVQATGVVTMVVGNQKAELNSDGVWEATFTPGDDDADVPVFAGVNEDWSSFLGLYRFSVQR